MIVNGVEYSFSLGEYEFYQRFYERSGDGNFDIEGWASAWCSANCDGGWAIYEDDSETVYSFEKLEDFDSFCLAIAEFDGANEAGK